MTGDNSFVIVANRLPVDRADTGSGWEISPGGLVAALAPVLRHHDGCWVGWPGEADTQVEPFEFDGIRLHPSPSAPTTLRTSTRAFPTPPCGRSTTT